MSQRSMVPEYAIYGNFGEVRDQDGVWLANVQETAGKITIEKKEIRTSGTRKVGYKPGAVTGEGTVRGLKVTSRWLRLVSELMRDDRQAQFVGQLIVKLDDPDSLGCERILLKDVKYWEINFGWRLDEIVEEEIPFTFSDIDFLNIINPNADILTRINRYKQLA